MKTRKESANLVAVPTSDTSQIKSAITRKVLRFFPELTNDGPEEVKQACVLYAHVEKAQFDDIERTWKQNPKLMFENVTDRKGRFISPLQCAFYNLNTGAWAPFYKWIQLHRPEMVPIFHAQNAAQMTHVADVAGHLPGHLSIAYWDFKDAYEIRYRIDNKDELRKRCNHLIAQQKKIPWHVIKMMCGSNNHDSSPANDAYIFDSNKNKYIAVDSTEFQQNFGVTMGIILHGTDDRATVLDSSFDFSFTSEDVHNNINQIENYLHEGVCELMKLPALAVGNEIKSFAKFS